MDRIDETLNKSKSWVETWKGVPRHEQEEFIHVEKSSAQKGGLSKLAHDFGMLVKEWEVLKKEHVPNKSLMKIDDSIHIIRTEWAGLAKSSNTDAPLIRTSSTSKFLYQRRPTQTLFLPKAPQEYTQAEEEAAAEIAQAKKEAIARLAALEAQLEKEAAAQEKAVSKEKATATVEAEETNTCKEEHPFWNFLRSSLSFPELPAPEPVETAQRRAPSKESLAESVVEPVTDQVMGA